MSTDHPPAFISRQVESGRYFFGDLTAPAEVLTTVACAGMEECAATYRITRERFYYHAIEFIVSGRWRLNIGKRARVLGPGAVFFYGPGSGYQLEAIEGKPLQKYFVDFTGPEAGALLKQHDAFAGQRFANLVRSERLRQIFDQLIDCADLAPEDARPMSLHLAELLLMRIRVDRQIGAANRGQGYQSYLRARHLMSQHHASLGSIDEAANACGLSQAYLSRLFKRFASEGALQYLTRLRMQHAADLLLRHSTNVQETAEAIGFSDPFHFSRVFKRVYGVSPRAFLESQRASGDIGDSS
ncbi:MAG: AraC family transcriptional regulator [Verrucomicrobiota bacterium]